MKKEPKTYTITQIMATISFMVAFLSAVEQLVALFFVDRAAHWIDAPALTLAITGLKLYRPRGLLAEDRRVESLGDNNGSVSP